MSMKHIFMIVMGILWLIAVKIVDTYIFDLSPYPILAVVAFVFVMPMGWLYEVVTKRPLRRNVLGVRRND